MTFKWHEEEDIPGFKEHFLRYLAQCEKLSYQFIDLIAEALGLEKDALRIFFDPVMLHHAKVRVRVQMWLLPADMNRLVGGQVSSLERCRFKPGSWPSLRLGFSDVRTLDGFHFRLAVMAELTSELRSCYRGHRTMGFRYKTFLATGLTCLPFLEHS